MHRQELLYEPGGRGERAWSLRRTACEAMIEEAGNQNMDIQRRMFDAKDAM